MVRSFLLFSLVVACRPEPTAVEARPDLTIHARGQEFVAVRPDLVATWRAGATEVRTANGGLTLELRGWGRSGAVRQVTKPVATLVTERLSLARSELTEWWESRDQELMHGFDVARPPPGDGWCEVSLATPPARVTADATSALFVTDGQLFRYRDLRAWDALGVPLEAWMEATAIGLSLVVDDWGAVYPITIDPVIEAVDWFADGDAPNGVELGWSVAWAGDVNDDGYGDIIAGAPGFFGEARVYYGSSGGLGDIPTVLYGDEGAAYFGGAVAAAGDVNGDGFADVIVGAHLQNDGVETVGWAYVFHGSVGGIRTTADWKQPGPAPGSAFGRAVASAGDVNGDGFSDVLVGSPLYESDLGAVWVYLGSETGLSSTPVELRPPGGGAGQFGFAVASAGDVNGDGFSDIIVGAYNGNGVDVFVGASDFGSGPAWFWADTGDLVSDAFGRSVATAGDFNGDGYSDVIVGAPNADSGAGKVFLYTGDSSRLWPASEASGTTGMSVGKAVNCAGDVNGDGFADVVVGSTGQVMVYFGGGTGLIDPWVRTGSEELYGSAAAAAGDVNGDGFGDLLVGAPGFDDDQANEGRVILHRGAAATLPLAGETNNWATGTAAQFGKSVALADLDGDGLDDRIFGMPAFNAGAGGVRVHQTGHADVTLLFSGTSGLGESLHDAGDVNGDGVTDLVVGSPTTVTSGAGSSGMVTVFMGSTDGVSSMVRQDIEGDQAASRFGQAVAGGCDVNGDGNTDLVVGAPDYTDGEAGEGIAVIYYGVVGGSIDEVAVDRLQYNVASAQFGAAVACAGDVNGDGFGDVVVGAPSFGDGQTDEGAAFLYLGSEYGPSASPIVWQSDETGAHMGAAVASAGDVNGDGLDDILVGAPEHPDTSSNVFGRAFLWFGEAPSGPSGAFDWDEYGSSDSRFGCAAASAGDVNGDGFDDFVVGADHAAGAGRVQLFLGTATMPLADVELFDPDGSTGGAFGFSTSHGDHNGDGFSDVIVGAPYDNGQDGYGLVYLGNRGYLANSRTPFRVRATQTDGTAIVPWGLTSDPSAFHVHGFVHSAFGRSSATLQVEVVDNARVFTGAELRTGAWELTDLDPVVETHTVISGLGDGEPHWWRARVLYDPVFAHPQGWSHWMSGGVRGSRQGVHVRTGTCVAVAADDVTCDLVDDDCDDQFDEDYEPVAVSCGIGACLVVGETVCSDGVERDVCTAGAPAVNDPTCDGIDDDCDNEVDEDFPVSTISCGVGVCVAEGSRACVRGSPADSCVPGDPIGPDTTCDGEDDDCNGFPDDAVDVLAACAGYGGPCETARCNAAVGECEASWITGCCLTASDCFAPGRCVVAACDAGAHVCVYDRPAGCCVNVGDCDDGNSCTIDDCIDGTCDNAPVLGCCVGAADCDDGDDCSLDECVGSRCIHSPTACANQSPCGSDSSCWYSGAHLRLGDETPSGVEVVAGAPVPLLQFVITNEAYTADLDALRLTLHNWGSSFSGDVTVLLFDDAEGGGQLAPNQVPLASVPVDLSQDHVVIEDVGRELLAGDDATFLVAVQLESVSGAWAVVGLLLGSLLALRFRRRAVWLVLAAGLVVAVACTYQTSVLNHVATIALADDGDVAMVTGEPNTRVWVQGAPIDSHPFVVK